MVKLSPYKQEHSHSLDVLKTTAQSDGELQNIISLKDELSPFSELIVCTDEKGNALGVCKTTLTGAAEKTVDYVFVHPNFRRDENGTLLLVTIMQSAVNRLITRLFTVVPSDNGAALAFFKKLGFIELKTENGKTELAKNLLYMYKTEKKQ